jgi:hypothetical protein
LPVEAKKVGDPNYMKATRALSRTDSSDSFDGIKRSTCLDRVKSLARAPLQKRVCDDSLRGKETVCPASLK